MVVLAERMVKRSGWADCLNLYLNFVGSNLVYVVELDLLHTVVDVVC